MNDSDRLVKNTEMNVSKPELITKLLHEALGKLDSFEHCALLDYPNHLNIGDHLIWMGTVLYLTDVLKTKINYTANIFDFSEAAMEKQVGKAPIFLSGGGSFGDLWPAYQKFRERIVATYKDRPIIILPQSIYFTEPANLVKTAAVFNSHPNLTLFVRDEYSYEIALQNFYNCQIIRSPDMAFQLVGMPGLSSNDHPQDSILYHYRQDQELNRASPTSINLPNLVVEDWVSFKWVFGSPKSKFIQSIARLIREVWQRGLATPQEWKQRQLWQHSHPYTLKFNDLSNLEWQSWSFIHSGIYQFQQHRLVITNRLHGHILCLILGIPHILLPNSYHKNESFYTSWTYEIPFCRFVKDTDRIKYMAQELLELFPR